MITFGLVSMSADSCGEKGNAFITTSQETKVTLDLN